LLSMDAHIHHLHRTGDISRVKAVRVIEWRAQ
jgi:hypothetical protein